MKKSLALVLMSIFAIGLILVGCGKQEEGQSTEEDQSKGEETAKKVSVDIGMLKLTSSAPLFIALEKGFFEEENIDAEATWFEAAQPIAVATAGGSVDVGATGITASLYNMVSGGQKLWIVADKGREQKGYSSSALLVPNDSDVTKVEDLKGKKLG